MNEVLLSLASSVVAATAAWVGQWLLRYRRLARKRTFFGVTPGATCILVTPRHFSSPQARAFTAVTPRRWSNSARLSVNAEAPPRS